MAASDPSAKQAENLLKNRRARQRRADELKQKLQESDDKIQQHQKEKAENWERLKLERNQKMDEVLTRKQQASLQDQEMRVTSYLQKENNTLQRMEEKKERERNQVAANENKNLEKLAALQELFEKTQAEREAAFRKTNEKLTSARQMVDTRNKERSKAIGELNEKRFAKKDTIILAKRKERFQKRNVVMTKIGNRGDLSPREKYLAEEKARRQKQREVMDELVRQNKERLEHASDDARMAMLNRIQEMNTRQEMVQQEMREHQLNRTLDLKDKLIQRDCAELEALRSPKTSPRAASPESPEKEAK